MKPLSISKQIIIIAILPALLVGIILAIFFSYEQLSFISFSQQKHSESIIKQLQPYVEFALINNELEMLKPVLRNISANNDVAYIKISDARGRNIYSINDLKTVPDNKKPFYHTLLDEYSFIDFKEPILQVKKLPDNSTTEKIIGFIEIKLNTMPVRIEKINEVIKVASITFIILLVFSIFIFKLSRKITSPIKDLTDSVRNITAGDLDAEINLHSPGEIGVLETCINHMKGELKNSRTDLEIQLNIYTDELQQTLEELEIRNAELDITRSKAIYANNAKSEFLANMSHEIRTPLSGVIGFTELLQDTPLSSQQTDYTDTIQKSAKNLLEIINDILDLSKIESGKTEISTSKFNLVDIIEDIINLLTPAALDKDVELFYRIEKDVPICIQADPFRIHQILTNLIGNAIKFTDQGYVYLQVTSGEINKAEYSIKFTVSDTGIGMSSSDKKKLFKAFTQADTSITRRFGGTGLGLVISRKLTLLMQGEIGFDSTQNEGSTFWFSVPVTLVSGDLPLCELKNKKIAFICNHYIAKQTYKTLFNACQCQVNDYSSDDFSQLSRIEKENDIIILFLARKEINNEVTIRNLSKLHFSIPSMLIASTRSHIELRDLQQHIFDCAVFSSEKIEHIKKKLTSTINKNVSEQETDKLENNISNRFDWSNINIMIVDDNDINLRLAEIILHKHKARVTTACSGAQAIDYASMNSYDIIFMDLHMPGIDGYETTQQIRTITPGKQPVIIALTANTLPQEKDKVMQSGMNGIIIKPVSDAILQKIISQWILKDPINANKIQAADNIGSMVENSSNNNNRIFSLEQAKEFTGNNETLAYELFDMLRGELDGYKKLMAIAVKNNDRIELRAQVHKLHGASRCCGTCELKEVSNRLENLLVQQADFDIAKELDVLLAAIKDVEDFDIEAIKAQH